jgi:hypothetical protein
MWKNIHLAYDLRTSALLSLVNSSSNGLGKESFPARPARSSKMLRIRSLGVPRGICSLENKLGDHRTIERYGM